MTKPFDEFGRSLSSSATGDMARWLSHVRPDEWKQPQPASRYHLVVLGAGPAGLIVSIAAAGLGAKVALVEEHRLGGDCLNVGCVPSKALLHAARELNTVRDTGLATLEPETCDRLFTQAMERMFRLRADLAVHDAAARYQAAGVDVFLGRGEFIGSHTVSVDGQPLNFRRAVICTGARAARPEIPGLAAAGYHTNESIFTVVRRPPRLAILGGGPIGCELASAFSAFGTEVQIVNSGPRLLPRDDADAAAIVEQALRCRGVVIRHSSTLESVTVQPDGKRLAVRSAVGLETVVVDEILVAAGRQPNIERLGLEQAGVEATSGGVAVNDRLQTSNPDVFAAGDVCSAYQFTHAADAMARVVVQNALSLGRSRFTTDFIPWCTYTSPEVAHVGPALSTLQQRAATGSRKDQFRTFREDLQRVDRGILDDAGDGFLKVHVAGRSDRILAATLVAPHAGETIGELVAAMKFGVGLGKLASVVRPYPTQAEIIKRVSDACNRERLTPLLRRLLKAWLWWQA